MNRAARFVWTLIGTAAMQKGPLWWAGPPRQPPPVRRPRRRSAQPGGQRVLLRAHRLVPERRAPRPHRVQQRRDARLRRRCPRSRGWTATTSRRRWRWPRRMYLAGGLEWLVWGFCVPTVTLAHATFAINTVNHLVRLAPVRHDGRLAQQRRDGGVRRRRGLAQQPPPVSARRAQRVLLVGIRSHVVRHPRHGGGGARLGRTGRARAHLRRGPRAPGAAAYDGACVNAAFPGPQCGSQPRSCSRPR